MAYYDKNKLGELSPLQMRYKWLEDSINRLTPQEFGKMFGSRQRSLMPAAILIEEKLTGLPSPIISAFPDQKSQTELRSTPEASLIAHSTIPSGPPILPTKATIYILFGAGPTAEFVHHYYFGNGTSVTLSEFGIADDFERASSVRQAIKSVYEDAIQKRIIKYPPPLIPRNIEFKTQESIDVTSEPSLFALGNGYLDFEVTCIDNTCTMKISLYDDFRDPLDLNEKYDIPDGWADIGGTPYDIFHDWIEEYEI